MADDPEVMQDQARRCRRLANATPDHRAADALTALAEEYDRRAMGLAPDTTKRSRHIG